MGDGAVPGGSPAELVFRVERLCGGRMLGCAGQCLGESNVPLNSPLLLGRVFWIYVWSLPWLPKFFARATGKLGFVPAWGAGRVLLFFLEVGQLSLAFGQWAGKSVLTMLPLDLGFTGRLRVSWFPRNLIFVVGYHTLLSPSSALARGPQLFCGAWDFKLTEMISGQPAAFFKL